MTIDPGLHSIGMRYKFWYSMTGLLLGLACIVAGVVLGLAGVSGHTSWTANLLGLSTAMTDAAPGVVIFVVGIFLVFITRFKVSQTTRVVPPQPSQSPPAEANAKEQGPAGGSSGGGGYGSGSGYGAGVTSNINYTSIHRP